MNPKYESLRRHLTRLIEQQMAPHDKLPTERHLAEEFSISRVTVRRALDELTLDGRVYRVQGAGTFVADTTITKTQNLTSFSEEIRERGMTPGALPLRLETMDAPDYVADSLAIEVGTPVVHIERVRTANSVPISLERVYLPANLVPGLLDELLAGSLYTILRRKYRIIAHRAEQTITAQLLDARTADILEVAPKSPALVVGRTTFDPRDRPFERTQTTYRADRYSLQMPLARGDKPESTP